MKRLLEEMTFLEFAEAMKEDRVILLPFGSQEVQGPCNPMGDFMLSRELALRVAANADALVAPTVPFGYADFFRNIPGSIQLSASTFQGLAKDMVLSLLDNGCRRLLILNGHTQNSSLLEIALREIRRETGYAIPWMNIWMSVSWKTLTSAHGDKAKAAFGHGCDPLGSVCEYFFPGLTRRSEATNTGTGKTFMGMTTRGLGAVAVNDVVVNMPLRVQEHCDFVTSGDPALSNAAAGEKIVNQLVADISQVVRHLRALPVEQLLVPK
jgi:creatinine amidohydrolase